MIAPIRGAVTVAGPNPTRFGGGAGRAGIAVRRCCACKILPAFTCVARDTPRPRTPYAFANATCCRVRSTRA
jgi:hypothetical protein